MLYQAYQAHSDIMIPVRNWAGAALRTLGQPLAGIADNAVLRNLTAAYELIARAGLTHARPPFGVDGVTVGNREIAVNERAALSTPFATLLHFKKDIDVPQPRVLLVAPLSGHFATLLRSTVRTMALGTSLFLIAVGAILRYAVSDSLSGVDIPTIGLILMVVGIVGLLISLFMMTLWDRDRRRDGVVEERRVVERRDPYRDPYA